MTKIHTVILADDHSILRAGLRSIIEAQADFEVVAEVDNGKDALKASISLNPDILITDISMPKTNGTECIGELKKRCPHIKVIVLTMHSSDKHIHTALNAGADGYILKDDDPDDFLKAIRTFQQVIDSEAGSLYKWIFKYCNT